jgi:hypothetical protein
MLERISVTGLLALATLLAACGGSTKATRTGAGAATAAVTPPASQAAGTATPGPYAYTRFQKYIPTDTELPERVSYQAAFDLSNESAAKDAHQLQMFRDTGRLGGIQVLFAVQAGARNISVGISYYNNSEEPRKLLRGSGDPAATSAPNRFQVPGLGDEYIGQRFQLGSGEASTWVINIVWVRGPFFVSLADLGGSADTPTDLAVRLARLIDEKLKANPNP